MVNGEEDGENLCECCTNSLTKRRVNGGSEKHALRFRQLLELSLYETDSMWIHLNCLCSRSEG